MLSERQAWLRMARVFEKRGDGWDGGMCPLVEDLYEDYMISDGVLERMLDKIHAYGVGRRRWRHGYFWLPTNVTPRIRFCRRMARNLERRKR